MVSSWIDNIEMDIDEFLLNCIKSGTIHNICAAKTFRLNERLDLEFPDINTNDVTCPKILPFSL